MTTTITAAFEDQPTAQRAQESLAEHGISRDKVTLLRGAEGFLRTESGERGTDARHICVRIRDGRLRGELLRRVILGVDAN